MKAQSKILLSTLSAAVVIAIILTVVIARQPQMVETAVSSTISSDDGQQVFEDSIYTEEDFMEGEDAFASENQTSNQNDIQEQNGNKFPNKNDGQNQSYNKFPNKNEDQNGNQFPNQNEDKNQNDNKFPTQNEDKNQNDNKFPTQNDDKNQNGNQLPNQNEDQNQNDNKFPVQNEDQNGEKSPNQNGNKVPNQNIGQNDNDFANQNDNQTTTSTANQNQSLNQNSSQSKVQSSKNSSNKNNQSNNGQTSSKYNPFDKDKEKPSGGKVTVLNNPEGWGSKSDKSKNSSNFKWPKISPYDEEAGIPITEMREYSTSDLIGQFVLMQNINTTLPFSVECNISDDNIITAMFPAGTQIDALKPQFTLNCDKLLFEGTEIKSGESIFNFTVPVELTAVSGNKKTKYKVYIMTLDTGLPSMNINTSDFEEIDSKTEYEKCSVFAGGGNTSNGDYSFAKNKYIMADAQIKGRGWTSWYYYPKKSYTLKFEKKQEMLGLPAHTEWVLAANFADRTLLRNAVAMELSHNLGAETVMDVRFVDLWVNGTYAGNYQLIEKVEVSKNRVDITKFDPNLAPDKVGYIIETNGHNKAEGEFGTWTNGQDADRPSKWQKLNENITLDPISGDMFFNSNHYNGIIFNINKPSDTKLLALKKDQQLKYLEYIYDYMDEMEAAIKSGEYSEASKYLDMEAMAKWYIVEELAMNTDSQLHCSCYMYKDAGGKMKMGPVWDFDLGFGNGKYANENHTARTYLDGSRWFADLLTMPEFKEIVKSIWDKSKTKIQQLPNFINEISVMLQDAQRVNFEIWSITEQAEHTYARTTEEIDDYSEQITYLNRFVEDRIHYMSRKISRW